MTGLLFYACCSLGLGWLIPGQIVAGHRQIGIDFLVGYCLVTILLFTFAVVFGLDLDVSIYLIMAAASAGILWRLRDFRDSTLDHGYWPRFHPLPVLIGLGAACIMVNGGIDYLPTTNDEFTSWIGNSRWGCPS